MNQRRKRIIAISGSIRNNSTNESILKVIANLYKEDLDIQIYDQIATLPYFNPDTDDAHISPNVKHFRGLIEQADGVIICTPEYVFSLPGALKNAIEWCVSTTVFSKKPTALIVASASGEKAFESLLLIMKTLEVDLGTDSALLIRGIRSKLNAQEEISDKDTFKEIEKLMNSFIKTLPG